MATFLGKQGIREGSLQLISRPLWFQDDPIEVIERKGIGHPDSICDALACELSTQYARYTRAHCDGFILHHQFDKVMLIGGKSEVSFGQTGRFVEPIRLIIAGRASTHYKDKALPVRALLEETARTFMQRFPIPDATEALRIEHRWTSAAGPGTITESTGPIAEMFAPSDASKIRGYGSHYVANDTSYCVAYAPLSPLERAVLALEQDLNAPATKARYPWMGTDIKIMAVRIHEEHHLTLCIPQIARHVPSLQAYNQNLAAIATHILEFLTPRLPAAQLTLSLNTKDNEAEHNVYLTVAGASFAGDIGVVGRGNRPNGLITSRRPMSLEGASGKNPRYYAGIIYNLAAKRLSTAIYEELQAPNIVEFVSQNGAPLLSPWHTIITSPHPDTKALRALAQAHIQAIPTLTAQFLDGKLSLF